MSYLDPETKKAFVATGIQWTTKPEVFHAKKISRVVPLNPREGAFRSCDIWFRIEFQDGTSMEMSNDFVKSRPEEMADGWVTLSPDGYWSYVSHADAMNKFQ